MHGKDGQVFVGSSGEVSRIQSWSYEHTADLAEDSAMRDTNKAWKGGLKDGTWEITVNLDEADVDQTGLDVPGTDVVLHLYPGGKTPALFEYTGTVPVESFSRTGEKAGIVTATIRGRGALTRQVIV
ncbi:MAG: hypothetical protein A2V88_00675 [Elusimicrobia bacterium RBG_16_66_12]|nr:MAG: hypothetical protein A2V88_00675 [Elusimicrobia bacterium RBG_16_66_12]